MDASPRERLAVALDLPQLAEARAMIAALGGVPGWLKVGSELFTAAGPEAVEVARAQARVFLDLKFHDIPNTVARAVASATRMGASLLTVHAAGGVYMLQAAREAAADEAARLGCERPRVVAVTVLTSLSAADLKEIGVTASSLEDQVDRLVELAQTAGLDGVVVSPREAARVRRQAGPELMLVTPGVRPPGEPSRDDDQKRTADAAEAVAAGADLLVVGRPVLRAPQPAAAAQALLAEIEAGLAARTG